MLTHGSLFSGAGGCDQGFDAAGIETRFQVEIEPWAQEVLHRHWPDVPKWTDVKDVHACTCGGRSLQRTDHGDHLGASRVAGGRGLQGPDLDDGHSGVPSGEPDVRPTDDGQLGACRCNGLPPVDVLTFGFPCQDVSVAGRRAGLAGARTGLFYEAVRIIKEMREATGGRYPTWAVAENVPGLLSADDGTAMGCVLDELAQLGAVDISWRVLDARFFGVPQRRRRVFIVACFDPRAAGRPPVFPDGPSGERGAEESGEAGPVIAGPAGGCLASSGIVQGLTGSFANGGADDNKAQAGWLVPTNSEPLGYRAAQFGTYDEGVGPLTRRYEKDGKEGLAVIGFQSTAGLLRAGDGGSSRQPEVLTPNLAVRRLTPRECERLMGWGDDWTRYAADGREIADSHRYRMCGNGVVAPVARWIAEQILHAHEA